MKLLIDAGNTRVKWALWDGRQLRQQGAVAHADIASLAAPWAALSLDAVLAASVAHAAVRQAIEAAAPLPVQWQRAQAAAFGVRNHYRNVAEQGADRWLAVLGARQCYPAQDVVIASAGTALTVEALTAEGDYLGGLILPGYRLMLASLAQNTANLDRAAGRPRLPAGHRGCAGLRRHRRVVRRDAAPAAKVGRTHWPCAAAAAHRRRRRFVAAAPPAGCADGG
ncbi:type III pantothenate kinase [Vogesella fluminis]|uniref:type III pantothenate kinase n=1 Tax=Vogesella fluminis TaxID=1069161 RepID=UPI0036366376